MKTTILLLGILLFASAVQAQKFPNFSEWFEQKKTQRKYLITQIIALQVYAGYLKKGYTIAKNGLHTIEDIKNGEFNLHKDFFGSLQNVNPHILNAARVADIIALQIKITGNFKRLIQLCNKDGHFSPEEIHYVSIVFSGIMISCNQSLGELTNIITPDKVKMTDDERVKQIERIYDDTQDRYAFVQVFSNETLLLGKNRAKDLGDAGMAAKLI